MSGGIMDGGGFDVQSVVGLDQGRNKAKGLVLIEAHQQKVVSSPEDARALAQNLLDGADAAERDETNAQKAIDEGRIDVSQIVAAQQEQG